MSRTKNPLPADTELEDLDAPPPADIGLGAPVAPESALAGAPAPPPEEVRQERPAVTRETFETKFKLPPGSWMPRHLQTPEERAANARRAGPPVGSLT